jgi:hypothetical protein
MLSVILTLGRAWEHRFCTLLRLPSKVGHVSFNFFTVPVRRERKTAPIKLLSFPFVSLIQIQVKNLKLDLNLKSKEAEFRLELEEGSFQYHDRINVLCV